MATSVESSRERIASAEGRGAGLSWRERAMFYVGLPVLLSIPQGFSVSAVGFSPGVTILWWSVTWLIVWWAAELFTRGFAAALKPWRPPLWLVLLAGGFVAGFSSRWWTTSLFDLFTLIETPPAADSYRTTPRDLGDPAYLFALLRAIFAGTVAWVVANYLFERITRVPRFPESTAPRAWLPAGRAGESEVPPAPFEPIAPVAPTPPAANAAGLATAAPAPAIPSAAAAAAPPEPRFLARMTRYPGTRLQQVLAVEAEDHYIKVHTEAGGELVYYRFTDALDDLRGHDGLQVHRSFWVRRGAIERVETQGRQWELVLPRNLRVPVSRANQGALRLAGLVR